MLSCVVQLQVVEWMAVLYVHDNLHCLVGFGFLLMGSATALGIILCFPVNVAVLAPVI